MMLAGWRLSKMLILGGTCLLSFCGCLDVFCAECLRALNLARGCFCAGVSGICGCLRVGTSGVVYCCSDGTVFPPPYQTELIM